MSDTMLKYMVATVIALLLVFQIGTLIASAYGVIWGVIVAALVVAILFMSSRLAKSAGSYSFWFLFPLFLFAIFLIGFGMWRVLTEDIGWLDRIINLTPFIMGFALPVILLLIIYTELRNRTHSDE